MISERVVITNVKVPQQELEIFTKGYRKKLRVSRLRSIVRINDYWNAVHQLLKTGDPSYLEPFLDEAVVDSSGRAWVLETRPRVLYRLAADL